MVSAAWRLSVCLWPLGLSLIAAWMTAQLCVVRSGPILWIALVAGVLIFPAIAEVCMTADSVDTLHAASEHRWQSSEQFGRIYAPAEHHRLRARQGGCHGDKDGDTEYRTLRQNRAQ